MAVRSKKSDVPENRSAENQEKAKLSKDDIAYDFSHLPEYSNKESSNVRRLPDPIIVQKRRAKQALTVDWSRFDRSDLRIDPKLEYNEKEEKREFEPDAPLKSFLLDDKRDFVIQFLKDAKPETLEKFFNLAVEEARTFAADPDALKATPASSSQTSAPRPADAPPLWAERTTGREVSPVDWIKLHYGPWLQGGTLSRPLLGKLDPALYEAYAKWSKRNPGADDLKLPTKSQVIDRKAKEFGILTEVLPLVSCEADELEPARLAMTIAMRRYSRLSKK